MFGSLPSWWRLKPGTPSTPRTVRAVRQEVAETSAFTSFYRWSQVHGDITTGSATDGPDFWRRCDRFDCRREVPSPVIAPYPEVVMGLAVYGDRKYRNSERLCGPAEWPALSVEHRRINAGPQTTFVPICTEVAVIVGGGGRLSRTGDGQTQESVARPGMSYLVPAGTQESRLELSDTMECLHIYMPPRLVDQNALTDHEIDPAKAQIAYVGGLRDRTIFEIGCALQGLLYRPRQPTDSLFVDGLQVALAA